MATTEFSVNRRDIDFVLFEQCSLDRLCGLEAYRECNRELFDMVLGEAVKVAVEKLAPLNKIGDRVGAQFDKGVVTMPAGFREVYQEFVQGGWVGMVQPPEYGGQGLPHMMKFAVSEVFSGANVAFFLTQTLTEGTAHLIERFGTEELKKIYVARMLSGEWGGTMCLTEPSAGSDVGNLKTTAKRAGDHFLISGNKIFITAGEHDYTPNIIHAVLARIEGAPAGTKGISLFLVPKFLVNPDGSLGARNDMGCGNIEHKMGMKASPTCTLNFGDEGKCVGWLLGEENQGMACMFQMMNEERLAVGLQGLSLAAAAYQCALAYAQERTQGAAFDAKSQDAPRTQIVNHPDVRRMLLHMKATVDGMRSLMLSVAKYLDLSRHDPDEKVRSRFQGLVELLTPICKAYGSDQGFRVNEMAVQCFGGYGYCQEYPVEQYLRDQKISSLYEGTNGIQAMDLLGRKIARNKGEWLKDFLGLVAQGCATARKAELAPLAERLEKASGALGKAATDLAVGLGKDPGYALLHTTPFLEAFGHVAMAHYLLEAASIAQLKVLEAAKKAGAKDEAGLRKLLAESSEAAFYHGRVASARYFIHNVLPHSFAIFEAAAGRDKSPLEVVFPS
ncbi:MAG TPA: acyl-CoA dehydrogenase [Myxococcota bacterium]|nr:acyl-CoA dehydrogenase [Myxococcota bacterium]HRY92346.1 acyl-CoA dehydrogenase [Myxococcota bacterium]